MNTHPSPAVLRPGRNCWKLAPSQRASVLVDAERYFAALHDAFGRAQRSILILGWDFDGRIKLRPQDPDSPSLGTYLRSRVEQIPDLRVDVLVWSIAVLHAPSSPSGLLLGEAWENHPRITVRLDTRHPIYAAHHQKIIVIDEALAFSGGMDLTVWRWDTNEHKADDPLRTDPAGETYGPVHDIQMAVDGAAACALGDLARERFRRAGIAVPSTGRCDNDLWPAGLEPDFLDTSIGIARTLPSSAEETKIEEIAVQTEDAIRAARTFIYIEAQYASAPQVAKALAKRLSEKDGPDIVILVTKESRGKAEQFVMGRNRERFLRRLTRADRHGRLCVYYPVIADDAEEHPIHIHSKLLIVDDTLLRVGSANLNNRSMGLDTECDLTIEGHDEITRTSIRKIRERLLGEHLGTVPEKVHHALRAARSMLKGIEHLNHQKRGLRPVPISRRGPVRPVFGTFLLDPRRPIEPLTFLRRKLTRWAGVGAPSSQKLRGGE